MGFGMENNMKQKASTCNDSWVSAGCAQWLKIFAHLHRPSFDPLASFAVMGLNAEFAGYQPFAEKNMWLSQKDSCVECGFHPLT